MIDPIVSWVARLLLASIFATAATAKLAAMGPFEGIVRNYRILPEPLISPFARGLPFVELAAALGLLFEPTREVAAGVCGALLLAFAIAMAINIRRGRTDIDCGCFVGRSRQRIGWPLVVRNLLLLFVAGVALAEPAARPLSILDFAALIGATLTLVLVYLALSQLLELAPVRRERTP
ncbi:Methylamine utilization protein MauE [bacterium HR40]|nr:Methylamine utilization protein MauE [bacterium HR40]